MLGSATTETTCEYVLDSETNEMKLVKKKVNEKSLPPNIDLIKMIFQQIKEDDEKKYDYDKMTDEQLEQEKQRLLKELKEMKNDSRKSKDTSKM